MRPPLAPDLPNLANGRCRSSFLRGTRQPPSLRSSTPYRLQHRVGWAWRSSSWTMAPATTPPPSLVPPERGLSSWAPMLMVGTPPGPGTEGRQLPTEIRLSSWTRIVPLRQAGSAELLAAHDAGKQVVGGSLDLPPHLPASARCDYYCGWYHVHSARPSGKVPNHPPGNLSVRRQLFADSVGFTEQHPIAYAHEELAWQSEVQRRGIEIFFQPSAIVYHRNRPGVEQSLAS